MNVNGTAAPDPRGAACDRDQLHVCSVFDSKQPPTPSQCAQGRRLSVKVIVTSFLAESQGREIKVSEALGQSEREGKREERQNSRH